MKNVVAFMTRLDVESGQNPTSKIGKNSNFWWRNEISDWLDFGTT